MHNTNMNLFINTVIYYYDSELLLFKCMLKQKIFYLGMFIISFFLL